jgi:hypothetical protein
MSKIKTNKEYAIKIIHPEFGEFYYSYNGWNRFYRTYIFTKNLSKVLTWKTNKFAEKQIDLILSNLEMNKGKIFLSLGCEVDDNIKHSAILSRKKYFYPIISAKSKLVINNAIDNIQECGLNLITLKNEIESINNFKDNFVIKNFESVFNCDKILYNLEDAEKYIAEIKNASNILYNFYNNSISYIENCKIVEDDKLRSDNEIYLDIVDASYKFRKLKLKNLDNV